MSHFHLSATDLAMQYQSGDLSPVDVTEQILDRAVRLNEKLNAFRVIDADTARLQAKKSEKRWQEKIPLGPLDGVPISIKDIVHVKGHACVSGSKTNDAARLMENDCPSVARLREAGAVLFGLTHTPEFGWKGITDSPAFGYTRNPWNSDHSSGGSSGGAGSATAAGIGPLALGTDAGGSVRIPASYCGIFGIKPTFGRVPHAPNESPYATLASVGPLSRTVKDAAAMLSIMSKRDSRDWYAAANPGIDFTKSLNKSIKGLKIAYSSGLGGTNPTPEIKGQMGEAVRRLETLGAQITEIDGLFSPLRPIFEDYWKAGFGYILRQIPREKWELLDPGFLKLAEEGLSVTIETYYDAASARVKLGAHIEQFFDQYDLLITPTMPSTAPRADTLYHSADFDRWDDATPYTVPFNLTGHPAASIPIGRSKAGLPIGMQIVGARFQEQTILQAAHAYEAVSDQPALLNTLIEGL
ncbi:MAG: amidase [Sneathiella sp.]